MWWQKRLSEEVGANCSGVATGSQEQTAPPRPPAAASTATSQCEPFRAFIKAQLSLKRNATAIYQDLVDQFGFAGQYNSVRRQAARLKVREPEQLDRLEFAPSEQMQVDYGEGGSARRQVQAMFEEERAHLQAPACSSSSDQPTTNLL